MTVNSPSGLPPSRRRGRFAERAAHRAKSPRQIQDADPGHHTPDKRGQFVAADRRAEAIPVRLACLLRLLPDPTCAHEPGSVDPPKITLVSLAAVAERPQSLHRTAPSWRTKVPRSGSRRFADGVLAHVRTPGGPTGPAQPLLRLAPVCLDFMFLTKLNLVEPPGTRPVCPVVWEGWHRGVPLSRSSTQSGRPMDSR